MLWMVAVRWALAALKSASYTSCGLWFTVAIVDGEKSCSCGKDSGVRMGTNSGYIKKLLFL